ncbi:S12A4 protein, partial [Crypturellus undulatus]|nr:S12A4 protein [Crypturellus undulatus]
ISARYGAAPRLTARPRRRPQLLVLLKLDAALSPTRPWLLAAAAQLRAAGGLTLVASVVPGSFLEAPGKGRLAEQVGGGG